MTTRRSKRRPRIVGVIASPADLDRALRMRRPPDLFELRLDRLVRMDDQLKSAFTEAARAAHNHSATPPGRRRREIIPIATA